MGLWACIVLTHADTRLCEGRSRPLSADQSDAMGLPLRLPGRRFGLDELVDAVQDAVQGRSARNHLRGLAQAHGLPPRRVDGVIAQTGLGGVAGKRAGGFSPGMRQRPGIAAALPGDPQVLLPDEPASGLDPEGVLWVRTLIRRLAAGGRTVLSSRCAWQASCSRS